MGETELSDKDLCTCIGQDQIPTYIQAEAKKNLTFKHSGMQGDLIYALPAIKELCRKAGFNAHIYIFLDRTWEMFADDTRPEKGLITRQNYEMLKPLLMALPFIDEVSEWKGESIHYDLDVVKYRGKEIGMPHSHISRWYGYVYPEAQSDLSQRVIDLHDLEGYQFETKDPDYDFSHLSNAIIVNRTFRNTNPYINYLFLNQYENVWFTGLLTEYEVFRQQVPGAKYLHVDDFLELAIAIGNCKLFIGNQSFCFSIAEQMKVPRLLEAYSEATNVIPTGPNGYDFYTQEGLETLTRQLWT